MLSDRAWQLSGERMFDVHMSRALFRTISLSVASYLLSRSLVILINYSRMVLLHVYLPFLCAAQPEIHCALEMHAEIPDELP